MFGYILRRIISGMLVLLVVSVSVFALFFYGPADPALAFCPETKCPPERLENIRTSLGLDEPVVEQYGKYMKGIFVGNELPGRRDLHRLPGTLPRGLLQAARPGHRVPLGQVPSDVVPGPGRVGHLLDRRRLDGHLRSTTSRDDHRQGRRRSVAVHQRDPLLPAGPARLPVPDQPVGGVPRERLQRSLQRRTRSPGSRACCWPGSCWALLLHPVRPLQPRLDDRVAQRGLRAHRPGQGALASVGSPSSTGCGRRSSRW